VLPVQALFRLRAPEAAEALSRRSSGDGPGDHSNPFPGQSLRAGHATVTSEATDDGPLKEGLDLKGRDLGGVPSALPSRRINGDILLLPIV
jgi:hypothetical protein